jgi:hypothetical protein
MDQNFAPPACAAIRTGIEVPRLFGIDLQEVALRINADYRSQRKQLVKNRGNQVRVAPADAAIDLHVGESPYRVPSR